MNRSRRYQARTGFMLMEVMIAVAIVSLMGGLIWGSFGPMLRAKEVIEAEAEHYRGLQVAMQRMTREISMAFISNQFDRVRYRDKTDMPTFFIGERDKLFFTALAHQRRTKDAKESDQGIFEYKMGRDPDEGGTSDDVLLRREKAILDDEPDRGGSTDILGDDVRKVEFEYWDDDRKEWVDTWSTRRDKEKLPERVRITLFSKDAEGKEEKFVSQAKIFMRTVLRK